MPFPKAYVDPSDLSGSLADSRSTDASITATSGGVQANSYQIKAAINRVIAVAAANDAVRLPLALVGQRVTIFNKGANALAVWPYPGDRINLLNPDLNVTISTNRGTEFICTTTGRWDTLVGA